jgi:hypothetical protein
MMVGRMPKRSIHGGCPGVTSLQQLALLDADAPAALTLQGQVLGIFLVDDLSAFWEHLSPQTE